MGAWADGAWASGAWGADTWVGMGGGSGGAPDVIPASEVRLDSTSIVPNIHTDDAVFTASTQVGTMEVTNVQTTNRDEVWRSTTTGSQIINFTFADGRARGFGFWGLFNHRLHGATVQFKLFSDALWSTEIYDSTALPVATAINLAQRFGMIQGTQRDHDLTFYKQPMWRFFLPMVYAVSGQLTITGTPLDENDEPLSFYEIGRFTAGPFYQFGRGVDFTPALSVPSNTKRTRTGGGSNRRDRGATYKKLVCNMRVTTRDDKIALESIMEHMADGRDGCLMIHSGRTGFRARTYLLNGCFTTEDAFVLGQDSTFDYGTAGRQLVFESN